MLTQLSVAASNLDPDLAQAAPYYREVLDATEQASQFGVDANTAIMVMAAVPVVMRILRMVNEFSTAWVKAWTEENTLAVERKRDEHKLQHAAREAAVMEGRLAATGEPVRLERVDLPDAGT